MTQNGGYIINYDNANDDADDDVELYHIKYKQHGRGHEWNVGTLK